MNKTNELKQHLQGVLAELERLSAQIRDNRDFSEQAEYVLLLRELVSEQIESSNHENTVSTAYQAG